MLALLVGADIFTFLETSSSISQYFFCAVQVGHAYSRLTFQLCVVLRGLKVVVKVNKTFDNYYTEVPRFYEKKTWDLLLSSDLFILS